MGQTQSLNYQSLRLTQEQDRIDMAFAHFFFAFLAIGAVVAEEGFIEGLSADEILNTEFEVEYAADDRTIDEIIAAAGTAAGAAKAAGENQEINYDMDMNMDPMQYEMEYGKLAGFAGAGMASSWYRWPKAIIPYQIARGFSRSQINWAQPLHQNLQRTGLLLHRGLQPSLSRSVSPSRRLHSRRNRRPRVGHTIGHHHEQCRPDRDSY